MITPRILRPTMLALLLIVTVVSAAMPPQVAESGRIEGVVVRSGSAEAISGVSITLSRKATPEQTAEFFKASAGRGPAPTETLVLAHDGATVVVLPGDSSIKPRTTDGAGRFFIEGVPAGTYAVNALREGYFGRGTDPETPGFFDGAAMFDMVFVTVEPGKAATAVLELIPGAVISGVVRSPQGTPLADQDVRAFRAHRRGEETQLRGVTVTRTDDLGRFRLHTLPPGEYFIASGLGFPEMGDGDPDKIAPKLIPGEQVPVLTFHPSAIRAESALPIVLSGGEDVTNKDIKVVRSRVMRISGRVIKDSGFPNSASAYVQLLPRGRKWRVDHGGVLGGDVDGDGVLAWASATFVDGNQGEFEFRGVFPQGSYEVRAVVKEGRREAAGSTMIDVGSADVEGLSIVASAAGPR